MTAKAKLCTFCVPTDRNTAESLAPQRFLRNLYASTHIGVDVLGLPHAIRIITANITNRSGAIDMVDYYCDVTNRLSLVKKLLADGGYAEENFANKIKNLSSTGVEVVKRNELHTFAVLPKRWIAGRSFAWLDKYRRFWKNCERKLQNSFQVISLVFSFTPE